MQLENDLMQGIQKMGYLNIETSGKEELVKKQIKNLASSKDKLDIERKNMLEKTIFVYSISCVMRQDKAKVLNCELCKAPTNTVIKLTQRSKRCCAACFLNEAKPAEEITKQEKQKGTMKP